MSIVAPFSRGVTMPRPRSEMRRIKEVLRLRALLGENVTAIASGAGLARSTVRSYLQRLNSFAEWLTASWAANYCPMGMKPCSSSLLKWVVSYSTARSRTRSISLSDRSVTLSAPALPAGAPGSRLSGLSTRAKADFFFVRSKPLRPRPGGRSPGSDLPRPPK